MNLYIFFVLENQNPSNFEQKLPNLSPVATKVLVIFHPPDNAFASGSEQVISLRQKFYDFHLNVQLGTNADGVLSDMRRIGKFNYYFVSSLNLFL